MKILFLIGHMVKERDLLLYELAESLSLMGNSVYSISGYPSRRIDESTRNYYLNNPKEEINANFISVRVGTKKGEGSRLFVRMIRYFFLSHSIYKCAKRMDADIAYIYSTPPFLGYYIRKLKRKFKVVYNAQDLFPESLVATKKYIEHTLINSFFKAKAKKIYNNANLVITISNDMMENIKNTYGNSINIVSIYNWADLASIKKIPRNENILFEKYNLPRNKFYISYAGDIGLHQNLDLFLDCAVLLKERGYDIDMVFWGNGQKVNDLKTRIKNERIDNVTILPFQDRQFISEVYSFGDYEILSLEKGMLKLAFPSKTSSIMAASAAIVGLLDSQSELAKIIKEENIGYCAIDYTPEALFDCIKEAYLNRERKEEMGMNARFFAEKYFDREKQTKMYDCEMTKLLGCYNETINN